MTWIRNNLKIVIPGGVALAAVFAFLAFGVFGIHTAFIDNEVAEDGPVFASGATAAATVEAEPDVTPVAADEPATEDVAANEPAAQDAGQDTGQDGADAAAADETAGDATSDDAADEATTADEAADESADAAAAQPPAAATPGEVVTLVTGQFGGRGRYDGGGTVNVLNDGTEQRFLRFEDDFATSNGPDLFVYLTTADADAPSGDFDEPGQFVNLGKLRGNIGSQNYEIPPEVDLSEFDTVAIWCSRFSALFATADLA